MSSRLTRPFAGRIGRCGRAGRRSRSALLVRSLRPVLLSLLGAWLLHAAPAAASALFGPPSGADTRAESPRLPAEPGPVCMQSTVAVLPPARLGGDPPVIDPPPPLESCTVRRPRGLRERASPRAPPASSLPLYLATQRLRI